MVYPQEVTVVVAIWNTEQQATSMVTGVSEDTQPQSGKTYRLAGS
jgi:hypothetical protein